MAMIRPELEAHVAKMNLERAFDFSGGGQSEIREVDVRE
jgi:hypothetical protein